MGKRITLEDMAEGLQAGWIAVKATAGQGQGRGFAGRRLVIADNIAQMYDNLMLTYRPEAAEAINGKWTQQRLNGDVILHEVEVIGCAQCAWSEAIWNEQAPIRLAAHALSHTLESDE